MRHFNASAERNCQQQYLGDYIKSLNIKIEISECKGQEMKKTALFNCRIVPISSILTLSACRTFEAVADKKVIVVRVSDKHGEYGIVGVVIYLRQW